LSQESKYGHSDDLPKVTKFILGQKGKVFIDIGANTGFYALNLAKSFKKIYAYEPFRKTALYVQWIIRREDLSNVDLRISAVSNKSGNREFFISPRGPKCHSILPVGNNSILIRCVTLASEFPNTEIDLIKVDVEGHEFEVLEGARKIIKNIKAWVIEVHNLKEICGKFAKVKGKVEDRYQEMERLLRDLGYEVKWITTGNVIYAWREEDEKR